MLWLAQPPCGWWPLAWIALVPWLWLAWPVARSGGRSGARGEDARGEDGWGEGGRDGGGWAASRPLPRGGYALFYLAAAGHWLLTLQGLRHAHPAMFLGWFALAFYLAIYPLLWLVLMRRSRGCPPWLAAPILWTGLEWCRNYFVTGISAAMLGHSQVALPTVLQIADLFGSYGVSFLIVLVSAAVAAVLRLPGARSPRWPATAAVLTAAAALSFTLGYGHWRLGQADRLAGDGPITIALLGRNEPIEFEQSLSREQEIFGAYFQQAVAAAEAASGAGRPLDAVVWPESMFTGGVPWIVADRQQPLASFPGESLSEETLWELIDDRQRYFERRAQQVQTALQQTTGQTRPPVLWGGCSILRYDQAAAVHSGCVEVTSAGTVGGWYGKTHLVMFGEYIPLVDYLPFLRRLMPPGLVVQPGPGAVVFELPSADDQAGGVTVAPNICIETAVERVTINQVRRLIERQQTPDYIVNVTNDAWFDGSSIVEHHLRCAQLVAIACRRPILIAANGGPTAWIDGSGRIVRRLANDESGVILVSGGLDGRSSGQLWWGDWPARGLAIASLVIAIGGVGDGRRHR